MTYTETTPSAVKEVAKNEHITSLLWILPEPYLLFLHKPATFIPTHPWQSNHCSTSAQTQQHDHLTFHSLPTPQHATIAHTPPAIGTDINITGPPPSPKTYQSDAEDILNTITANADNNLQRHERGKLGRMHKPSTPNTPFIHGDEVIGELYRRNMVLIPFTIDPWARFGPMLQAFLTTTHHPRQKPWRTTHTNSKYHRPNANLVYERASQPPCPLGILTSADIRWTQSVSPTRRTFFGNSYTAPTPSLHTLQLVGLSISKAYSSLLCNATRTFQRRSATIPMLFDCCLLVPMLILLTLLGLIQRHHPIDAENSANTSRGMVQFQHWASIGAHTGIGTAVMAFISSMGTCQVPIPVFALLRWRSSRASIGIAAMTFFSSMGMCQVPVPVLARSITNNGKYSLQILMNSIVLWKNVDKKVNTSEFESGYQYR